MPTSVSISAVALAGNSRIDDGLMVDDAAHGKAAKESAVNKDIDKDVASEVSRQLLDVYLSVKNATKIIQERCLSDELEVFRSEAGRVAGGLYFLLEPLWRAYPDFAPEGLVMIPPKKKGKR